MVQENRNRKILAAALASGSTLLSYQVRSLLAAFLLAGLVLLPGSLVAVGAWYGFKRWHAAVRKEK